jgi:predicted nucleic acid-binding protein
MAERQVFDTDVLVDYLRGAPEAVAYLEERSEILMMSAVSVAELFAGVREGKERTALQTFISAFEVVPVDKAIAEKGGLYRRDYQRSHGLGLADAIIAATADSADAELITLNVKHFPMRPKLAPPYAK